VKLIDTIQGKTVSVYEASFGSALSGRRATSVILEFNDIEEMLKSPDRMRDYIIYTLLTRLVPKDE